MTPDAHVAVGDARFALASWGDLDGDAPLALLAHGFPDTPATWRHLGPRLAAAGFRVAAPWMRGYAPTTAPATRRVGAERLADDLAGLHGALDGDARAVVVGHDWGSLAAARAAATPGRFARVVLLAVPPEAALADPVPGPGQARRSWYMLAAQLPVERLPRDRVVARIVALWRDWSPGYTPTTDDLDPLRRALHAPGGLRGVLAPYRALPSRLAGGLGAVRRTPSPVAPTLHLHGADDGCIAPDWVPSARRLLRASAPASDARVVDGVGHFLHLEDPDGVGDAIVDWCAGT